MGFQASQLALSSAEPLNILEEISGNLPSVAVGLSKVKVNSTTKTHIQQTRAWVEPGKTVALLNGRIIDLETIDPYYLYPLLREEIEKVSALERLGLQRVDSFPILLKGLQTKAETGSTKFRVNSPHILWVNNLESDSMYAGWSHSSRDVPFKKKFFSCFDFFFFFFFLPRV